MVKKIKQQKSENVKKNCTKIGGQAVLEGVMMLGQKSRAVALHAPDGRIIVESKRLKVNKNQKIISKIPIIRGVVNFFRSMVLGVSVLMRSAEIYTGEEEKPSKFEAYVAKKFKINVMNIVMGFSVLIGLALAVTLFIIIPTYLTNLITSFSNMANVWLNLIEGVIRLTIFILYILSVSFIKDIKRTFMYHGAEHKTISCFEKGLPLTVENVQKQSTIHDRCGTTFLFLVMIISIVFYSLIAGWQDNNIFIRVLIRLALLPLIAGVSYEILKFLAKFDNKFIKVIKAPGLLLQKLTTKAPTDDMCKVAICAFTNVYEMDSDDSIAEKSFDVNLSYSQSRAIIDGLVNDSATLDWIYTRVLNVKRSEIAGVEAIPLKQHNLIALIASECAKGKPLQYVLGDTVFYGYTLKVNKNVLIPRPETELLAEKVILALKNRTEQTCLDLCTGSGCIAIAVKKQCESAKVTGIDVSKKAINIAKVNAKKNNADVQFTCSNLFAKLKKKTFDVIVSNPPYIKSGEIDGLDKIVKAEPILAQDGGIDGLDFYNKIVENASDYLNCDGLLFLEVGINQADYIKTLLANNGFTGVEVYKDYNNIDRIIKAKRG